MKKVLFFLLLIAGIAGGYYYGTVTKPEAEALKPTTEKEIAAAPTQVTPQPISVPVAAVPEDPKNEEHPGAPAPTADASNSTPFPSTDIQPAPIDANWSAFASKDGNFKFHYPAKGTYWTTWEYAYISKTDGARLNQDGCYLQTDLTVHHFTSLTPSVCQTTSGEKAESGTRTDYIVTAYPGSDKQLVLLTLSRAYKAGFDQAHYQAVIEQIIATFNK